MPWKIIEADYDPTDLTTFHDDELIAIERALSEGMGHPANENNPKWRAREKVRPLAERCTGAGDPVHLLPAAARASPVWASYPAAQEAGAGGGDDGGGGGGGGGAGRQAQAQAPPPGAAQRR